jgi:uncharacterized delta-60 repeat protein
MQTLYTSLRQLRLLSRLATFLLSLSAFAQPGSLDPTFAGFTSGFTPGNLFSTVQALPDGKILVGGGFPKGFIRLNADGTLDNTFNPGGTGTSSVSKIVVQSDGKILISGGFDYNGTSRPGLARLNADGTLDTGFDPVVGGVFALQPDGKVVVSYYASGEGDVDIVRLNTNGTLDPTFIKGFVTNPSESNAVTDLLLQSDGKIVAIGNEGGDVQFTGGTNPPVAVGSIFRLNTNGTLDNTFNVAPTLRLGSRKTALQADNKLIFFKNNDATFVFEIARLNTNGILDNTFNAGTGFENDVVGNPAFVGDVVSQADGDIMVVGTFARYRGTTRRSVVRINGDGSVDTGFNPGTGLTTFGSSIALAAGGKYLVGGTIVAYNGTPRVNLVRINADGTGDNSLISFQYGFFGQGLNSVLVQPDNKVVAGGIFSSFNGASRNNITRLNTDGTNDNTFNPGTGFDQQVNAIVRQAADGKLWVGGNFTKFNTANARNGIVRLKEDGSWDGLAGVGTGDSQQVYALAIRPTDGRVFAGGTFTTYNTATVKPLIMINQASGVRDNAFNPAAIQDGAQINAIAVQADGKVLAGGSNFSLDPTFTDVPNIYRFNANGTVDGAFNTGTGVLFAPVNAIAILPGGNILIGGGFSEYKGTPRSNLALLDAATGNLLPGFATGTDAEVKSIVVQTDGKILVGGGFSTPRPNFARFNADGTVDATFNTGDGPNGQITSIAQQTDGKIIVGGGFALYGTTPRDYIARVLSAASCPTITLSPATATGGTVGTAYSQTFTASGGTAPYTFAVSTGTLPAGLTLSAAGVLSGTPTTAAGSTFTVQATATGGCTGTQSYTLTVAPGCSTITLSPATLPGGIRGVTYNQTLTATGGATTFSVSVGTLPAGLTLTSAGVLSGTPTATGSSTFTIRAATGTCFGSQAYTVAVACPVLSVTPATLPTAVRNVAYSQTLTGAGGTAPYTFSLATGSTLPTGLTLTAAGILAGTPATAGSTTFTVQVASGTCSSTQAYTLVVNNPACPALTINPATLTAAPVSVAYNQSFSVTGGTAPYTFAVSSGALPAGLTLTAAGVLSGTPTTPGTTNFTVRATDANSCQTTRDYIFTVSCPAITLNPSVLPSGTVGAVYNQALTATGGTGSYTFTVSTGTLPAGLTLSGTGELSGTPTAAGSNTFTVRATSGTCSGTQSYTLTVGSAGCPAVVFTPATLPNATVGTAYSQIVAAAGGSLTFTLALTTGSTLPAGLNFNAATSEISGTPTAAGASTFTIRATSGTCTGTQTYTLTAGTFICPTDFTVAAGNLPPAVVGTPYTGNFVATGGTAPYTYAVTSGTLPTGLTLNTAGGVSGTPAASESKTFTIRATDDKGCTATRDITLVSGVGCAVANLSVNPATLPPLPAGGTYTQTLTGAGGTAPYTFVVSTGTLPAGLTLNLSTGVLSGSTTVTGGITFTVQITDANGCTGTRDYSLCVNPQPKVTASNRNSYSLFTLLSDSPDGNQWLKDGQLIQGATRATLEVKDKGSYQVRVTVNGCNGTSEPFAVTAAEPGIVTFLTLYPNPADGELYIQYRSATGKPVQFVSVNVLGVVMNRITPVRNSEGVWEGKLPTGTYPAGSYLLRVEEEGTRQVKHFVKR